MDKYYDWMNEKLRQGESCLNKCAEWTLEMQEAFPELTRVRGHVLLTSGIERPHWWLEYDGQILDPTSDQFLYSYYGCSPIILYTPFDESKGEPIGKCMNCGEFSWYTSHACSEECETELRAYYG